MCHNEGNILLKQITVLNYNDLMISKAPCYKSGPSDLIGGCKPCLINLTIHIRLSAFLIEHAIRSNDFLDLKYYDLTTSGECYLHFEFATFKNSCIKLAHFLSFQAWRLKWSDVSGVEAKINWTVRAAYFQKYRAALKEGSGTRLGVKM